MTDTTAPTSPANPQAELIIRAIERRSVCVLATVSPAGRPHSATVIYSPVDGDLWFSTLRSSRKGRNLTASPFVGVTIPIRRLPVGPPSTVTFQGTAAVFDPDDPLVRELAATGRLKAITSHGELDLDDGCFVRIRPNRRMHTYGLGLPLRKLVADPLNAGGLVELPNVSPRS